MNTKDMDNKQIASFEYTHADGNTYTYKKKTEGDFDVEIRLSATHHGDHDQFWVTLIENGKEVNRFNCRSPMMGHIEWEKDSDAS